MCSITKFVFNARLASHCSTKNKVYIKSCAVLSLFTMNLVLVQWTSASLSAPGIAQIVSSYYCLIECIIDLLFLFFVVYIFTYWGPSGTFFISVYLRWELLCSLIGLPVPVIKLKYFQYWYQTNLLHLLIFVFPVTNCC